MSVEIRVPALGESITEATVGQWLKKPGETVKADEPLVELETDKVTLEVPAPAAGVLEEIRADKGTTVAVGAVLGAVSAAAGIEAPAPAPAVARQPAPEAARPAPQAPAAPQAEVPASPPLRPAPAYVMPPSPAARKILAEAALEPSAADGTGRRGQVLKHDAEAAAKQAAATKPETAAKGGNGGERGMPVAVHAPESRGPLFPAGPAPAAARPLRLPPSPADAAREERVKMTRLRQTIARRLKEAQNTAAILTTFNDVDMSAVLKLRTGYKELFEKRHGVKLGFMGFFVKACVQALKEIPAVNAEIDGDEIVYKNYYHIGVAVGTEKGLVVPVLHDADRLSLAEIELAIVGFGVRAREGRLGIEDMQGGTFTISNGGVYGSLLSTPILNAPQSGILGMHRIEERPVVRDGKIEARPMMYLALSYDHRLVDGREAVTFLVRVKEGIEDPQRFMLEL